MLYFVTSLAFDPDSPQGLLHRRQLRLPRPHGSRRRHRQEADAAARRAHRRPRLQSAGQVDLGHPPPERLRHHRPHPAALCRLQPDPHLRLWQHRRSTSTSRRTDRWSRPAMARSTATQSVRVWKMPALRGRRRAGGGRAARPAALDAGRLHLLARRQVACTAPAITPASRTSSASTSPRQKYEVLSAMPRPASSGRCRGPTGSCWSMNIPAQGLNPSLIRPESRDDLGTVEFLGTKVVKTHPELKKWGVGSPAKVDLDELITERGMYNATRADEAGRGLSDDRGLQAEAVSPGYYFHFEDPMQFHQLSATVSVSPFGRYRRTSERLHADIEYQDAELEASLLAQRRRHLRSGRAGRCAAARATRSSSATTRPRSTTRRASSTCSAASPPISGSSNCRPRRTSPARRTSVSAEAGVQYTNTRKCAGRRRS